MRTTRSTVVFVHPFRIAAEGETTGAVEGSAPADAAYVARSTVVMNVGNAVGGVS